MKACVIDANAAIAWLFGEAAAERIPSSTWSGTMLVPSLWRLEVTNVILTAERRKRHTAVESTRYLKILGALDITVVPEPQSRSLERLAHLARPHHLTAYDAAYLELALTMGAPLCTLDKALAKAARTLGVSLVGGKRCS